MGLLTNPADFTAATLTVASLNTLKNTIYSWAGTTVNGQGSISSINLDPAAGILITQVADTAVVRGNTTNPGTQTITRPTSFGEGAFLSAVGLTTTSYTGGTLTSDGTSTSSALVGPVDLKTYTLPAGTLTTLGRGLKIRAWGSTLNDATAKTISLRFGGQTLITKLLAPSVVGSWEAEATVIRSGANTQSIVAQIKQWTTTGATTFTLVSTDTNLVHLLHAVVAGTQTEAGTIVIKVVADIQTVATSAIIQKGLVVEVF